jgi:glycosyltransferase involved in cell wall biosynthesis
MLIGMAREIRKLGVPVVCSLSGEDLFLEKLSEPFYAQARAALAERARDVDAFVAMNRYYADRMAEYLQVSRERVFVVPHGLNLEGHGTRSPRAGEPFTIGYLARICHDKGLHNLIAAAELLSADPTTPPFRVRAAGYLGEGDRGYLNSIAARVANWSAPVRFEYVGELTRAEKIAFLQGLDCMSLPTVYHESKGLSVLEAMANAVPVVLPNHGAFPELIAATGSGVVHEPDSPSALATALRSLMNHPQQADEFGFKGQQAIRQEYHAELMAQRTLEIYRAVSQVRPELTGESLPGR